MLRKLTKEQEKKMFEVRDYWNNFIDSCENSINKEQAVIGINWLYESIKKQPPKILFVQSPMACQIAVNLFKNLLTKNVSDNISDNVWHNVRSNVIVNVMGNVIDNVSTNVRANVRDNVWDNVRANISDNVWRNVRTNASANLSANLRANLRAYVWDNVRDNVRDNVSENVGSNVRDSVWANVSDNVRDELKYEDFASYGSIYDCGWVSFYDFFTQIGVLNHDGFNKFKNLISSGVYDMIQMDGLCVVSDLPCKLIRNQNRQMHCTTGYAIEFKDGYGQYYINGRNMPDWVFSDNSKKEYLNKFLSEENEDIKAGVITLIKENHGADGLLKFLKAEIIDEKEIAHFDGYTEIVRLYKTKDKYSFLQDRFGNMNQPYCWTEITCPSTGSTYLIDNSADFTCAKKALEFLRPSFVPEGLEYKWEHSAN